MSQKILICDDTPTVLDFLELVFEKQGFEVIRAGSGAYALEAAAEHHPDLLLVDAMMPGMDGFEVCRRLRAQPDTASETILMYSAIVGEEVRARALSAGADEFLGKMISHAELVSQVRDWLAARSAPRRHGPARMGASRAGSAGHVPFGAGLVGRGRPTGGDHAGRRLREG